MPKNLIKIIKKKELTPNIFKYNVILFPMGVNNSFGNNFSYEVALNFPDVKISENETGYGDLRKIGTIHETETQGVTFVACYVYCGNNKKLNYDALTKCLTEVKEKYHDCNIGTVFFDENEKDDILSIFNNVFDKSNVTIYDYESIDYRLKIFREIAAVRKRLKDKEIDKKEYIKIRSNIEWRRKNGIFAIQPNDYEYLPKKNKSKLLFRGSKKQF